MAAAERVTARLELEFDGLKAHVAQFLVERSEITQEMVNKHINRLISDGHIERMVQEQITREVQTQLKESIKTAVSTAFWDEEIADCVTKLVISGMKKAKED